MGFIRKKLGVDLTGGGQEDAARKAALQQEAAGERALKFSAEQVAPFRELGISAAGQLPGAQFAGLDRDPNRVLNNPLFAALQKRQEQSLINQQGALGRGGSGETNDLLMQNILQLGNQFQQQDFNTQLAENSQTFNQLFDQIRMGANVSTQQATQGGDIMQGIGNARSAGTIGIANSQTAAGNRLLQGIQGAVSGGMTGGGAGAVEGFVGGLG
tara:strand:- start:2029 stop:2670 length:642 start_codon:yes stop_codon:yes gene_type:complete